MDKVTENTRILIVDDNEDIHHYFRGILSKRIKDNDDFDDLDASLFGEEEKQTIDLFYQLDAAYQGQEAIDMVNKAAYEGNPYAAIFMDVRMPPGFDGIETCIKIWEIYNDIEIAICTAFTDYSWDDIIMQLGANGKLSFVKKPFDEVVIKQMALTLTRRWNINKDKEGQVENLRCKLEDKNSELTHVRKLVLDLNQQLKAIKK